VAEITTAAAGNASKPIAPLSIPV